MLHYSLDDMVRPRLMNRPLMDFDERCKWSEHHAPEQEKRRKRTDDICLFRRIKMALLISCHQSDTEKTKKDRKAQRDVCSGSRVAHNFHFQPVLRFSVCKEMSVVIIIRTVVMIRQLAVFI